MQEIVKKIQLLNATLEKKYEKMTFQRTLYADINRSFPCVGIVGERGVGKTTLMFQHRASQGSGVYITCDMDYIQGVGLYELISFLYKELGERRFYLDEIHEYPGRQLKLKNLIDSFPDIYIVFSGSSSTQLSYAGADLSRRALIYTMRPLNFQEYLKFFHAIELPRFDFHTVITDYKKISYHYADQIKQTHITHFLQGGSYPFRAQYELDEYYLLLLNALKKVCINDVLYYTNIESQTLLKLQQLFVFLVQSSPSEINYSNLSKKLGVDPKNLSSFIDIISQIGVVNLVHKDFQLTNKLRKEKKIYIGNTSLLHAAAFYQGITLDIGIVRETAVIDIIRRIPRGEYIVPRQGDVAFSLAQRTYLFEIGGKNKTTQQIKNQSNAYLIKDDILIGTDTSIPFWLFLCIG